MTGRKAESGAACILRIKASHCSRVPAIATRRRFKRAWRVRLRTMCAISRDVINATAVATVQYPNQRRDTRSTRWIENITSTVQIWVASQANRICPANEESAGEGHG